MTDKVLMRRRLTDAGLRQPRFLELHVDDDYGAAFEHLGVPAVVKPARSAGQRGVFRVSSAAELGSVVQQSLRASPEPKRLILEEYVPGSEVNVIAAVVGGEAHVVTISDRVRPQGLGFGIGWAHVFPSRLPPQALIEIEEASKAAIRAMGVTDAIAFPQVLWSDAGEAVVVEVAARMAGGQMWDVVEFGTGINILAVAIKQACQVPISPAELRATRRQPLAIRFLTGPPGVLPVGRVCEVPDKRVADVVPGVQRVLLNLREGQSIREAQVDGDRLGSVLAIGETTDEALARADEAAQLLGRAVLVN